jgi:hypothetical protein
LDEGRGLHPNRPERPSPATAPYHKKRQMFLSVTKAGTPRRIPRT